MVWNAKARQPTTAILYNKDPLFVLKQYLTEKELMDISSKLLKQLELEII